MSPVIDAKINDEAQFEILKLPVTSLLEIASRIRVTGTSTA